MSKKNEKSASRNSTVDSNTNTPGTPGGVDFTRGGNSPSTDVNDRGNVMNQGVGGVDTDLDADIDTNADVNTDIGTRHQERVGNRANPNTTAAGETSSNLAPDDAGLSNSEGEDRGGSFSGARPDAAVGANRGQTGNWDRKDRAGAAIPQQESEISNRNQRRDDEIDDLET